MMEDFYVPTDIQFKDDLRKEEIKLEELLNLLKNQEYEKLQKKLERDLKRVRESLQDQSLFEKGAVTPTVPSVFFPKTAKFILSKLDLLCRYPPVKFRKIFL